MKKLFKKLTILIGLSSVLVLLILIFIATRTGAIEFTTGIAIIAVLISTTVLLITIHDIRNRLRPWVAVARIDIETTNNPAKFYSHFIITNTGPIPATQIQYTTRWYLQNSGNWEEIEIPRESPFTSALQTLFPNQSIDHRTAMKDIRTATRDKDTKVTFKIEYRGLWSKHSTTNTHKFIYTHKVWAPDEPQGYT